MAEIYHDYNCKVALPVTQPGKKFVENALHVICLWVGVCMSAGEVVVVVDTGGGGVSGDVCETVCWCVLFVFMIRVFKVQLTRALQHFTRPRANVFLLLSGTLLRIYTQHNIFYLLLNFTRAWRVFTHAVCPCERPNKNLLMIDGFAVVMWING